MNLGSHAKPILGDLRGFYVSVSRLSTAVLHPRRSAYTAVLDHCCEYAQAIVQCGPEHSAFEDIVRVDRSSGGRHPR